MERMYENVGSDITGEEMSRPEVESEIGKFYKDTTIFLTGATGFLGQLFMEKLLRASPDINKIYVLIRPKKGKDAQTRFQEIFKNANFEPLYRKNPNFINKIKLILGDISTPNLGLNENDRTTLISETNLIIHCAATVRFDEKLRLAANINIRSVQEVISMAKLMKNLKGVLYISTAFSQCVHTKIDEKFYDPPITASKFLALLDTLDDDKLDRITEVVLDPFPNTYVFTKAIAEHLISTEAGTLPIGICRPSIVIATAKEPIAGWIDNLYGATGVLVGAALGVLRSLHGQSANRAEIMPADYVINTALAALWDVGTRSATNDNREVKLDENEGPIIYNCVSSPEAPITWDMYVKLGEKHAVCVPSKLQVWAYCFSMRANWWWHLVMIFLLHTVPAYFVDFLAVCVGRKPILVKGYKKINKFTKVLAYFSMREWIFTNANTQQLWRKMNSKDKELYEFSMAKFCWDSYFFTYVRGCRAYLLKDPLDTLAEGRRKYYILLAAHYSLCTLLLFCAFKLFMFFVSFWL